MSTKIITVAATPPSESSGADYNKGAPLNATEFDQNLINLRAAVDRRALASSSNAFTCGALTAASAEIKGACKISAIAGADFRGIEYGITDVSQVYASAKFRSDTGELKHEAGFTSWGGIQTFYTNGLERMRVHSTGSVLVGLSTAVTGAKLEVAGSISATSSISLTGSGIATGLSNDGAGLYVYVPTGKQFNMLVNASTVASVSSTGLAVTGGVTASGVVDCSYGGYTGTNALHIGANIGESFGRTDAVAKFGAVSAPHYSTAQEPTIILSAYNTATENRIELGGGLTAYNAITSFNIYCAANNTTVTGAEVASFSSTGLSVTGGISATGDIGNAPTTWAPTLGGTSSLSVGTATYKKIGKLVSFETTFTVTSLGTGSAYVMTGIPFTPVNTTAVSVGYFSGIASNAVSLYAYIDTAGNIVVGALSAAGVSVGVGGNIYANGTTMRIAGTYYTA
jgi:hypothetical protein